jgi:hypothetical protein
MAKKLVNVWYDHEGDFLEVILESQEGYFQETKNDRVMKKVDSKGRLIGFSILGISSIQGSPLKVTLYEEGD